MTTHFLPKTGRILKTLLKFDCLLHISRIGLILIRLTPSMKHVIRKCIVVFSPLPPSLFLKLKHYSFQSPTFSNTHDASTPTFPHGRSTNAFRKTTTAAKTLLKTWIHVLSIFLAVIRNQLLCKSPGDEFLRAISKVKARICTKKRTTRAKLLLALLNLLLFWPPLCPCKRILKKCTQGRTRMTRTTGTTVKTRLTGMTGMNWKGWLGWPRWPGCLGWLLRTVLMTRTTTHDRDDWDNQAPVFQKVNNIIFTEKSLSTG